MVEFWWVLDLRISPSKLTEEWVPETAVEAQQHMLKVTTAGRRGPLSFGCLEYTPYRGRKPRRRQDFKVYDGLTRPCTTLPFAQSSCTTNPASKTMIQHLKTQPKSHCSGLLFRNLNSTTGIGKPYFLRYTHNLGTQFEFPTAIQ